VLNNGEPHFWEWDDTPLDVTPPTINDPTTEIPWFIVDADPLLPGSYRIKSTVNGVESSVEVLAVPTANIASRIPSFQEEIEYDENGNPAGWHRSQTDHMRAVDKALGDIGSSTERAASMAIPIGATTKTIRLGRAVYPGSLLAIAAEISENITSGSVLIEARVNGVVKLSATLSAGTPGNDSIVAAGVHNLTNGDLIDLVVTVAGHANASSTPSGVAISTYLSNSISSTPISIADASNVSKGITKLSVAPALATEPVAVGTNDLRMPLQAEKDALVGTNGTPTAGNPYVTNTDPRNSDTRTPTAHSHTHASTTGQTADDHHAQVHDLGGADHNSATLAQLNAKVSDATLINTTDPRLSDARTPTAHSHAHADTTGKTTDDHHAQVHGLGSADHGTATHAQLNAKVSDQTLAALDVVQAYTKQQHPTPLALTDTANIAIAATDRNAYTLAAGAAGATREIDNATAVLAGMSWTIAFTNDTGARDLTFGSNYSWGDETPPTFTTQGAGEITLLTFYALSPTKVVITALTGH
jgi:hypothetical protein